jgi:hypothetical protein
MAAPIYRSDRREEGAIRRELHHCQQIAPILQAIEQPVLMRVPAIVNISHLGVLEHPRQQLEQEVARQEKVSRGMPQLCFAHLHAIAGNRRDHRRQLA